MVVLTFTAGKPPALVRRQDPQAAMCRFTPSRRTPPSQGHWDQIHPICGPLHGLREMKEFGVLWDGVSEVWSRPTLGPVSGAVSWAGAQDSSPRSALTRPNSMQLVSMTRV